MLSATATPAAALHAFLDDGTKGAHIAKEREEVLAEPGGNALAVLMQGAEQLADERLEAEIVTGGGRKWPSFNWDGPSLYGHISCLDHLNAIVECTGRTLTEVLDAKCSALTLAPGDPPITRSFGFLPVHYCTPTIRDHLAAAGIEVAMPTTHTKGESPLERR